jgi:hypothetical protein
MDAPAAAGWPDEAHAMFGSILSCRNHLGMLAEDLDPKRNPPGVNSRRIFSRLGPILSAMHPSRSWEHGLWGG